MLQNLSAAIHMAVNVRHQVSHFLLQVCPRNELAALICRTALSFKAHNSPLLIAEKRREALFVI